MTFASEHDLARIPYGAVYFRKSNPPKQDWERDYRLAAEDGINIFRHWFLWGSIEIEPGVYDWDDYDRQFELAEKYGIKTIVAEMITATPEWLYYERPEGRLVHADGRTHESKMGGSSSTGGFHAMSLDDEVVRAAAGEFLTTLVGRYRSHPAMGGYDIWNECNYVPDSGYIEATAARFRSWLQRKYGDLRTLGNAWGRYSYSSWEQIFPAKQLQAYVDAQDWLLFQADNAFEHMRWRIELIRGLDDHNPITAHGIAASLVSSAANGADDWRSAKEVDSYGCTWVASRQGDAPWQHLHAMDLARAASRGKDFWHAEAQGGPLWLQPQVLGRPLDDGRVTEAEDLRLWNLTSFCGGARGLLYPRWRPLLNGPLFGAFGPYAMDGSRTPASDMAGSIARWANAEDTSSLWDSAPIKGEVGIIYAPESQMFELLLQGSAKNYTVAARGAYQGFFSNNIQADFVHLDDISEYRVLYLPYPIMLSSEHAEALRTWVRAGGSLLSEGCPAYFGDDGWVGTKQPNYGLDEMFGADQQSVLFTPDLLDELRLEVADNVITGGVFQQRYLPTDGTATGWYADRTVAAVDHEYGAGRTRLVGSFPSIGYSRHPSEGGRSYFADLLTWSDTERHLTVSSRAVTARIFDGDGGRYLWLLNPTRRAQSCTVSLAEHIGGFSKSRVLWGGAEPIQSGDRSLEIQVSARDALIVTLDS